MREVDAHLSALVHAYQFGGLNADAPVALDAARRRAVLTLYVRWIAEALELTCDYCGNDAVVEHLVRTP